MYKIQSGFQSENFSELVFQNFVELQYVSIDE